MHHTAQSILDKLANDARRDVVIELGRGDTAWRPDSTKDDIFGPTRVQYHQFADGGIDYRVEAEEGGGETPRPITIDGGLPTHGRLREDHGSRTEADAGAFEAAHAYRPSRLEDAMDRGYDPEPGDYR